LTSNANDRLTNWNKLKQDPILGVIATQAIDAQFTVTEAMKNAGEGGAVSPVEAQATIRNAINAVWDFINGNEQYKKDYENTVHAYQVTYAFFEANPSQGAGSGSDIFNSNLNGTAANSQGAMAAAILMSLGSTQNILDAYLSGK
jgi:hypothetical protein